MYNMERLPGVELLEGAVDNHVHACPHLNARTVTVFEAALGYGYGRGTGARALGMEQEIDSLEPGKKANLLLLDLARPHLAPFNMPAYRAVCCANGNDVQSVIVNGEVVLENRRAMKVDETAIIDKAQLECDRMIARNVAEDLLEMPDDFFGQGRRTADA